MSPAIRPRPESKNSSAAKVLIVDDHPAVREGMMSRISRQDDMIVCGEATGVTQALALVETTLPDVVVIDLSLNDGDGIDLIKRIRARGGSIRMLVCSMHPDRLYAERSFAPELSATSIRTIRPGASSRRSGRCATARFT